MVDDADATGLLQAQQQQQTPMDREEFVQQEERRARLRELLKADAEFVREVLMTTPDPNRHAPSHGFNRFIDARLPLWGVLGSLGGLALILITMWFDVQALTKGQSETQALLREAMAANAAQRLSIVRLDSRQEQIEETIRDQRLRLDALFNQMNDLGRRIK